MSFLLLTVPLFCFQMFAENLLLETIPYTNVMNKNSLARMSVLTRTFISLPHRFYKWCIRPTQKQRSELNFLKEKLSSYVTSYLRSYIIAFLRHGPAVPSRRFPSDTASAKHDAQPALPRTIVGRRLPLQRRGLRRRNDRQASDVLFL